MATNSVKRSPARLRISISAEEAKILQRLADEKGQSITAVVRKAISVYDDLKTMLGDEGNKVLQMVDKEKDVVTTLSLL